VAEQLELQSDAACEAYVNASSTVTSPQMQDMDTGVPHFGYAAIMLFYSRNSLANSTRNSLANSTSEGIPSCFEGTPPSICTDSIPAILNGTLSGKDLQNCANAYLFECSEDAIETGLCAFLTAGAGSAFCASPAGQAVFGVLNTFLNQYIEKPIVKIADSVEDGAVSCVKTAYHWFTSLF
jgi:hypothetical protein